MNAELTCAWVEDRGLVERYLAGAMDDSELAEFEAHYLTCERCQEALRVGASIRRTLPRDPEPAGGSGRRWLVIGAPVGLAAALAGIVLFTGGRAEDPAVTSLGHVAQAPVYLGIPVRSGAAPPGDSLFDAAMRAYMTDQFADAAAGLRAALDAGVAGPPAEFFLGASLLMTGQPGEAIEAFARVLAFGETPYQAEAHLYRAKALLQLGRGNEALTELRQVPPGDAVAGRHAGALADSVEEIARRP